MKQQPRLMRGGLTGRIYVATRYRELANGAVEALEKFDVTEDFERLGVDYLFPAAMPQEDDR